MATIHDEIDNWLAADLHGQLTENERETLHSHLVECAACRRLHQEHNAMHKALEERFEAEKPDPRLEQRVLARFRTRFSRKSYGLTGVVPHLMELRSARIAGFAGIILVLIVIGNWLTNPKYLFGGQELAVSAGPPPGSFADLRQRLVANEMPLDPYYRDLLNRVPIHLQDVTTSQAQSEAKKDEVGPNPVLELHRDLVENATVSEPTSGAAGTAEPERVIVTGSNIPTAEEVGPNPNPTPSAPVANRKLIRNATIDLEVVSFEEAVQKISGLVNQDHGYIATTSSEKQSNGKLKGEIVVKVNPENLDRFLQSVRGLGGLKNQTIGSEDITKAYFDTDAHLKNSRIMEQRLVEMLKKSTGKVSDLLQVEKELGRVREEIEKMQGDIKYWDTQVQFATVTISLTEKDIEEAANFLLKERVELSLYTPEVDKVYADIKALASPKVQITNAQLDRNNNGRVSAKVTILIVPEESERIIQTVKAMGRVENFQVHTEREAQDGSGMAENAHTRRDKVELAVTISRDEQEQALQQTTLAIRTSAIDDKTRQLRELAAKQEGRVRNSSFSRDPDGREFANLTLRVPIKNYPAFMQSLNSIGKPENVSVQRQERSDAQIDEATAPADITIQIFSEGNLVSREGGLFATLRHTISQGAAALMWSLRMIGVAIAFLLPWAIAIAAIVFLLRRARRKQS